MNDLLKQRIAQRNARVADKFTLVRSLVHGGVCHDSGPQQIFTGRPVALGRLRADYPDLFRFDFDIRVYASERLRAAFEREQVTGVEFRPAPIRFAS